MSILSLVLAHKLLVFFIVVSAGLCISTIVLGVNVSRLKNELNEEKEKNTATTATSVSSTMTQLPPVNMSKYRLPTTIKPKLYDLYLYPNLTTGMFRGTVIVSLSISEPAEAIVLHINGLHIESVSVKGEQANFQIESAYEIVTITRKNGSIFTSSADSISIEFNGDMKNRIVGLYTSSYTTGGKVTKNVAPLLENPFMTDWIWESTSGNKNPFLRCI